MSRLCIAILTYRRPEALARALPYVLAHARALERDNPGVAAAVLVVDNDPAGSAEAAVAEFGDAMLRYVREAEPGISAARNRALDEAADAEL
ncbi:MAG: glycosyltransferase family 2 protein, partial [Specibacter sp.]